MKKLFLGAGGIVVFLGIVSALHIQLTHKGIGTFLLRMKQHGMPTRGDLVVGFLPVT